MNNMNSFETCWCRLTEAQQAQAQKDYETFFRLHGQKNPSDLNTDEKWEYANRIGKQRYAAMLAARKQRKTLGLDWTLLSHWQCT